MSSKSVALITMSLRPARVGANVAAFVKPILEKALASSDIRISPVDLRDFNLPIFDENVAPAMVPDRAQFAHEHSKVWSAEIKKHDGYVIVIPEYNYGVAGGTKNAIDYLKNEWVGKPLAIVSYGVNGGSLASQQVKDILSGVGLKVVETRPQLAFVNFYAVFPAMLAEGTITDETIAAWQDKSDEIVKAAGEIKELLLQPNEPANVAH
ncbi:NADPH-dependent FMN reductase [Nemania sp. NC0429]|nr:NADPH-dependent FMN reductase [Nemania sp. NC0429]